jgi:predicted MFS family arabinose efflux permease
VSAHDPGALRLASAGVGIVGVSFGMARYGYGLLLPDIRRDYDLGPAQLGAIGTGSYVGYLAATALAGTIATGLGARRTAITAGLLAAAGMIVAGLGRTPAVFVVGILIAGTSAGFAFAPFADAARAVPAAVRGRVLAAVNCGTGYGVALAAPIAILVGASWRDAWLAFAVVAVLATLWTAYVLPGRAVPADGGRGVPYGWAGVLCSRALPLLTGGVLIGLGSSTYWTFAVEHLTDAGGLSSAASATFLGIVGVASVLATLAADLVSRVGPRRAFMATTVAEAAALALLALVPSSLVAAIASAILFGTAYNATVAIQAIWSTHVFSQRPSLGLSAAMSANGVGLLLGPLGAGLLAGAAGFGPVLLVGAGVVTAAGLLAPREPILPQAESESSTGARGRSPSVSTAASLRSA